jgi:diguanylate cyclase (GGDEF)-like protein
VSRSRESLASNNALMAYTAAAMYGGAALDELITGSLPGDPPTDLTSVLPAIVIAFALARFGSGLSTGWLAILGPIGVVMIAQALIGAPHTGDAAVLYVWPVVWSSFFLGRRGAIGIVATIAVAHAVVLAELPAGRGYPGRWFEVMIPVCTVALVIIRLAESNELLLGRLAREARIDSLTGLLNRRGFEERAALSLAVAAREGVPMALAMFDIDHFKRVNDDCGHDVGDRVLARTARIIERQARETDVVARFGGEEFVVLLAGADLGAAHSFAERVRDSLAAVHAPDLPVVRVSVGVDVGRAADDLGELQRHADEALYRAKRAGRDRTIVFERARLSAGGGGVYGGPAVRV